MINFDEGTLVGFTLSVLRIAGRWLMIAKLLLAAFVHDTFTLLVTLNVIRYLETYRCEFLEVKLPDLLTHLVDRTWHLGGYTDVGADSFLLTSPVGSDGDVGCLTPSLLSCLLVLLTAWEDYLWFLPRVDFTGVYHLEMGVIFDLSALI